MEHPPKQERFLSREIVRQELFTQMVASRLRLQFVEDFKDAMFDAGIKDHSRLEQISKEFLDAFAELSEEDKSAVLAVPYELRAKKLEALAKKAARGTSGEELLLEMRDTNKQAGNTLGYHMSPVDIPEPKDSRAMWVIRGTGSHQWCGSEDHSAEPTGPMAFYSLDYMHRYLKKPMAYLYVVVAKVKPGEGHGRSNAGTWGHAPQLDVIQKIDMLEVEKELDMRMEELGYKSNGNGNGKREVT